MPGEPEKEREVCPICHLEFENGEELLKIDDVKCLHYFHKECMELWEKTKCEKEKLRVFSCPICRREEQCPVMPSPSP